MPRQRVIGKRGTASYLNGVIDVACPKCLQPGGRRCLNMGGTTLFADTAHADRIKAAKEVQDANQNDVQQLDVRNDSPANTR